jgi:UDP-N-acetylglucosamine transferase subunit ALG13
VIFLTVGSHEPFDRLIAAMDAWAGSHPEVPVFAQITDRGRHVPRNMEAVATLDQSQYRDACARASLLVAHAGMGSIITALDCGKPIVIMPRRGHLKETRNDHQMATIRQFRGRAGIFAADDEKDLATEIDRALAAVSQPAAAALPPFAEQRFIDFLAGVFRE